MGYKLAGFEHLGGVEIDKSLASVYKENHNPKYMFLEDIREFNKRTDLPIELYDLDLLDGSPPCSTFSSIGLREAGWGKNKVFREGQANQTLDDLVFVYLDTVKKLNPKTFILENVKGIIKGNAKSYARRIVEQGNAIGYAMQAFCLNGATMGLPQTRERVFFIGARKDLNLPKLRLEFNEKPINFSEISDDTDRECRLTTLGKMYWNKAKEGDSVGKLRAQCKEVNSRPAYTICGGYRNCSPLYPREINDTETKLASSFPMDYKYSGNINYLCGMSVPPVMTAQISHQIYLQWLCNA